MTSQVIRVYYDCCQTHIYGPLGDRYLRLSPSTLRPSPSLTSLALSMIDTPHDTLCSLLGITSGVVLKVEDLEHLYIRVYTLAANAAAPSSCSSSSANSWDEDLLAPARIRAVQLKKERGGPQHEYLLVYITIDGLPKNMATLGIIKCERTVPKSDQRRKNLCRRGFLISNAISNPISSSSMNTAPAYDHFTIYDRDKLP